MRYAPAFFALFVVLASCTHLKPEGVLVRGSVWLVPQDEVRSAIAVARVGAGCSSEPIKSVIIASRSELYVYFTSKNEVIVDGTYAPSCAVMRKEHGRWRYVGIGRSSGIPA